MIRRLTLLVLALGSRCAAGEQVIYQVPENGDKIVGARDENIMADDVHFGTASIVNLVRIRLAIRGTQTCKLWLFEALNSPPLHVAEFTNVPAANERDMSTYDVPMSVQVPKDVFVGFSAQGDGWTNKADFWSQGDVVHIGVAGTPGIHYYGPVTGEQLTAGFNIGSPTYGCLQILSEPVRFDGIEVATDHVGLAISSLPVHATNCLEQIDSLGGTNWAEVETLPRGVSNCAWTATNFAPAGAFYRVKSR